jgi:hypothetical protein
VVSSTPIPICSCEPLLQQICLATEAEHPSRTYEHLFTAQRVALIWRKRVLPPRGALQWSALCDSVTQRINGRAHRTLERQPIVQPGSYGRLQ